MNSIPWRWHVTLMVLMVSIAAMPDLVNGETQSLSTVNKDKSSNESQLKDSIRSSRPGIEELISVTLKNGRDSKIGPVLAPIIGLTKEMPMRKLEVITGKPNAGQETRGYFVIYENKPGSAEENPVKQAVCAYIVKAKRNSLDHQVRYHRIDLNGKLEKAVITQSKFAKSGEVVKGSGVKTELNINSPEVQKTFEAEMKFWLNDWLKKQSPAAAPKPA